MTWTTPAELKDQVERLWERGKILAAAITGDPVFPLNLRLRRPDRKAMADRFEDVRLWIRQLEEGARPRQGFGYDIEWTEIEHRQLGRNRVPSAVVVPTRDDALRLIGKSRAAARAEALTAATLATFPVLHPWIIKKPLVLLEHANDWDRILAVLSWFRRHPRSALYLRQLDIPGVDTKFIEARKSLLAELLDLTLPPDVIDATPGRSFEARYGLRSKPPLVRFRLLDARHRIGGLSDVATPIAEFDTLALGVRRIFITENEINGLAFPDLPDSAVIFGLGYGIDGLAGIAWLKEKSIHYWGDIDTHGFAILDRLRASCPDARSILMDRDTLLEHRALWVTDTARHPGALTRLTPEEQDLFEELAADTHGDRVRLEQERLGFGWVERALAGVAQDS